MARENYSPEFREKVVSLFKAGRSASELSAEFGPHISTIRAWAKQAALDSGERKDGLTSAERDELRQLRRELKQVKMERDILAKATAWFAGETQHTPPKRSS